MSDSSSSEDEAFVGQPSHNDVSQNKFEETTAAQGTGYDALASQEDALLGPKLLISFKLPDGSFKKQEFRMGHTVEWLKQALEDNHGLPYARSKLLFNGKMMIDPLSLSDIAGLVPNAENEVDVQEV
eukprot:TRINITY_DN4525_c0_g1_i1.p1 TRINITY_DN4525_c0_g1~~TRINITY_DN4525_c0_g1_i1.p1  ORF type:complete len:127 (+),score=36.05 TRINITY_DN4525_c0_g1_i1:43-423(+)